MPCVFLSRPSSVLPCSSRHAYPAQAFPNILTVLHIGIKTEVDCLKIDCLGIALILGRAFDLELVMPGHHLKNNLFAVPQLV